MELYLTLLIIASIYIFAFIIKTMFCSKCVRWMQKGNNSTESRIQENFEPSAPPIHQIYQPITITEQYLQHHRQYLQDSQNMTAVYSVDSETIAPRFTLTARNSEFDSPPSYDQIFSLNHFPSENSEIKPTAPSNYFQTNSVNKLPIIYEIDV